MYGAPLDLSFRCNKSLSETGSLCQSVRSRNLAQAWKYIGELGKDFMIEEPGRGQRPLKRNHENKYASRSLRLNNNVITDLSGLHTVINHFLAEPMQLAWLDLSFNDISHIDPVLCELGQLRVLYLHGNTICNLSEVDQLVKLPFLHTITLHGNVIEGDKDYRCRVISTLAKLKMMDFSAVTPQDRSMANIWFKRNSCGKCKIKDVK